MTSDECQFNTEYVNLISSEFGVNVSPIGRSCHSKDNLRQYYDSFVMDSIEWFICKYSDCENTERHESDMTEHVRQHMAEDNQSKHIANTSNVIANGESDRRGNEKTKDMEVFIGLANNSSNDFMNWAEVKEVDGKQVLLCLWIGCHYSTNLKIKFKQHLNKHLEECSKSEFWRNAFVDRNEGSVKSRPLAESTPKSKSGSKDESNEPFVKSPLRPNTRLRDRTSEPSMEPIVKSPEKSKTEFKYDLRKPLEESMSKSPSKSQSKPDLKDNSSHSLNESNCSSKPMTRLRSESNMTSLKPLMKTIPKPKSKINYRSKRSVKPKTKQKTKQKNGYYSEEEEEVNQNGDESPMMDNSGLISKNNIKASNLINVNIGPNATLSLKGMASVAKLKEYIDRKVIDNKKVYFCRLCPNKCLRTQQMAHHIHTAHIGMYFKCIQTNCNKVFRTPTSWREHQKNHICNFGILGYQKGVVGPCRTENLYKWRQVIVLNDEKAYRCTWTDCKFESRHRAAIKRHIHDQHVCPYRNSDEWKKKFNESLESNQKSPEIPMKAMIAEKDLPKLSNRLFSCHRTLCNARFANEADLRKHENLLCKYKPLAKKGVKGSRKQKLVSNVSEPKSDKSEDLSKNVKHLNKNEKSVKNEENENCGETEVEWTSSQISDELKTKCEEYILIKRFEGICYNLCHYLDCKYVVKEKDAIYDHIIKLHLGTNRTPNQAPSHTLSTGAQQSCSRKRSYTSTPTQINEHELNECEPKAKKVKIESNIDRKESQNSNQMRVKQNHVLDGRVKKGSIGSETHYFCAFVDCKYYSNELSETLSHFESHNQFHCDVNQCTKYFKNENLLNIHKRNHLCGFWINGTESTGVCSKENVRKYMANKKELYCDRFVSCSYATPKESQALQHIHNRHLCPNKGLSPKEVNNLLKSQKKFKKANK